MNPRIQELADEATKIVEMVGPQGYASSYANFDRERFAELIVQECARVYWNIDNGELHSEYVRALKKHFEVEE